MQIVGTLTVGHCTLTAATVTPGADILLGLVLAKLNAATREAILRELPADIAAAGAEYPTVPDEIVEAPAQGNGRARYSPSARIAFGISGTSMKHS